MYNGLEYLVEFHDTPGGDIANQLTRYQKINISFLQVITDATPLLQ